MLPLFLDVESFSWLALRTAGTSKYTTQSEVMTVQWALGVDAPVTVWDVTSGGLRDPEFLFCDPRLQAALEKCDFIIAHNAYFDRTLLNVAPWWPKQLAPLSKWRCMMAWAFIHGLPGGLDKLCEIFKVDDSERKRDGSRFIDLFCKPKGKKKDQRNSKETHPAEWVEFLDYAHGDITSMQQLWKLMPKWNFANTPAGQFERDTWHLDQRMNDRGVGADVEFAAEAVRATTAAKKALAERTVEITDGAVDSTTQRDKLLSYLLLEYGVELPDLTADTIERRLDDPELPEFVKELLRIRLQASKASTSKYKRVMQMEVAGRLYGTLQYAAANRTGRWGGRGFQPQNLMRPKHKQWQIEQFIAAAKQKAEAILWDPSEVMALAASSMRGVLVPAPGRKFVIADLSNIEGRKLAWLAGEEWKLQAFREFDAGIGKDLYILAYARAFDVHPDTVIDEQRQIGKVMELALGYEGGVGAFVTMSATYGIDLDELARKAWPTIPCQAQQNAQGMWKWANKQRRTLGLSEAVYCTCEALKAMWREAHPATKALWPAYQSAAINAVQNPGTEFHAGRCTFDRKDNWLRIRLPSGRFLCYPSPRVDDGKLSYMGVNVYSKKWHRIDTYGGKIAENIDQASSRDIMAYALPEIEKAGYPLVLTVHDEVITEPPDSDEFNDKELSRILATNPPWAPGLPLAAKGFTTYRYRKG